MSSPFHDGEREMQQRAGVREEAEAVGAILASRIPSGVERFLARQRLAAAATRDRGGRVWVSILAGPPGFVTVVDPTLLHLRGATEDVLAANLEAHAEIGMLVLDVRTRQRMRFNGRGRARPEGLLVAVEQVYGNCPKYIQRRQAEPDGEAGGRLPRVSDHLDAGQQAWIEAADTLFIGSVHPTAGADASHRGGFPGFVRVLDPGRVSFPDYPGNAMFNTLGNLARHPRAGLAFVDFTRGDVLQLSGRARVADDFSVTLEIESVRETLGAIPLRYALVEYSPANPGRHVSGAAASQGQVPPEAAEEEKR